MATHGKNVTITNSATTNYPNPTQQSPFFPVDPHGSDLAVPATMNSCRDGYLVEGIGYDFIPDVLDRTLIDTWRKSNDKDSFLTMRRAIRYEGLLCGGSCGGAISVALEEAKRLKKGQTCVVVLPDSVRNYMTKALSDDWMRDNDFFDNDIIKEVSGVSLRQRQQLLNQHTCPNTNSNTYSTNTNTNTTTYTGPVRDLVGQQVRQGHHHGRSPHHSLHR